MQSVGSPTATSRWQVCDTYAASTAQPVRPAASNVSSSQTYTTCPLDRVVAAHRRLDDDEWEPVGLGRDDVRVRRELRVLGIRRPRAGSRADPRRREVGDLDAVRSDQRLECLVGGDRIGVAGPGRPGGVCRNAEREELVDPRCPDRPRPRCHRRGDRGSRSRRQRRPGWRNIGPALRLPRSPSHRSPVNTNPGIGESNPSSSTVRAIAVASASEHPEDGHIRSSRTCGRGSGRIGEVELNEVVADQGERRRRGEGVGADLLPAGRVGADDEQAVGTARWRPGECRHAVQTVEGYRPVELHHPATNAGLGGEPRRRVGESRRNCRPVSAAGRRSTPTCRRKPAHGRRRPRRTRSTIPPAPRRRIPVVAPVARSRPAWRRRPSTACCPCPR